MITFFFISEWKPFSIFIRVRVAYLSSVNSDNELGGKIGLKAIRERSNIIMTLREGVCSNCPSAVIWGEGVGQIVI